MDLVGYFKLNFALMQYHKYSLTEIENLIPWERDVYVALLKNHLEEEEQKQKERQSSKHYLIQHQEGQKVLLIENIKQHSLPYQKKHILI